MPTGAAGLTRTAPSRLAEGLEDVGAAKIMFDDGLKRLFATSTTDYKLKLFTHRGAELIFIGHQISRPGRNVAKRRTKGSRPLARCPWVRGDLRRFSRNRRRQRRNGVL